MLTDAPIVYLFLYVRDLAVARAFYEETLGLRVLEEDEDSVKYDTGPTILALNRAADYGITLPDPPYPPDLSTDIVFLVDDIDSVRAALEKRGVQFTKTDRYEIGAITDFYDPDGHWFTLYETSDEAMSWPSGDLIRAVRDASNGNGSGPAHVADDARPLAGAPLVYLFLFVRDAEEAVSLYSDALGLRAVEGGPCSRESGGYEDGVVKYGTGGVILTTHHLETVREEEEIPDHPCPPRSVNPILMGGKAIVFHTGDIQGAVSTLSGKGVQFTRGVVRSEIGAVARFADPSGHVFYLYEPSANALRKPSGAKIESALAGRP